MRRIGAVRDCAARTVAGQRPFLRRCALRQSAGRGIDLPAKEPAMTRSVRVPALLVVALVVACASAARASVQSVAECLEGADFIANAARARDNGIAPDRFLDRLDSDLEAIRAFPPPLRWFARDDDDAAFLRTATEAVFREPVSPDEHRAAFLRACFARLGT
jgi:hypothetical protein